MAEFVYVPPEHWREALREAQSQVAWAKLVLDAVERGQTIITGEYGNAIFFTAPEQKETPFE